MSDDRQEVILLATTDLSSPDIDSSVVSTCTSAANTGVLTKLIAGSNTTGTNASNTFILYIPSFRKIEPKPELEVKTRNEDEEKDLLDKEANTSAVGRFLAINATKRGVKTCPVCQKKIGYRAKQCKHCSPSKNRNPRRHKLQHIKPSIRPIGSKTVQLVTQHVACSTSDLAENDNGRTEQECLERIDNNLLSSDVDNQQIQQPLVTSHGQQLETIVSPLEHNSNQEFEGSLTDGANETLVDPKVQEAHLLSDASHECQPQGDQHQLTAAVSNILNQQEKVVIEDDLISNITEVSTSADCTPIQETSQSENQEVLNTVFISSKVAQNVDNQALANSGRYSLQDLICGLLAQNQGASANQTDPKEVSTSVVGLHTESGDSQTCDETETRERNSSVPVKEKSGDTSYDANSVALFLGEMAQRNNGKKRKISPSKVPDGDSKVIALIPGTNQKCILMTGNDHKSAKFRKIQPKDIGSVQEEITVCDQDDKEMNKDVNSEMKGEPQCRIMNGNATRRGVMLCSKCSKMIGCRSKICKHCKHSVTESTTRPASNKLIKQAVKLCLPAELDVQIYSVRKCKTGPELRCFVQFDSTKEPSTASKSNKYACDYPLCVTAKELGDKTSAYMCEHARFCCNSTNILLARVPMLDFEKLAAMDCSTDMKDSVQKLHGNCQSKGVPLVQYVSSRTLAVVEEINVDPSDSLGMGILTFAHVRFENVKGQGCFQRQVFCSGRSCMAWNFLSNDSNATTGKPCSCVHYAAALWAIASDASLQKDLGEYLDAFVSQVKPGDSS